MSFEKKHKMLLSWELKEKYPLDDSLKKIKQTNDNAIKNILNGTDDRKLVIIGPCSIDSEKAILCYLEKLYKIKEKIEEKLFIVPRIYSSKPRTTGQGYKGYIHQMGLEANPSMLEGIQNTRELNIKIIKDYGFGIADEMLYTFICPYFDDLLSYVAIGARSVEDQQHRILASGLDCCVGFKNPMSGDISVMLNGIKSAQHKHNFIYDGYEVDTTGNSYSHAILRGAFYKNNHIPNYKYETLLNIAKEYGNIEAHNKAIIVDANHSNSAKDFKRQPYIIKEVIDSIKKDENLRNIIKGFMIESYIEEGFDTSGKVFGKSITDGCIDIETTKRLLFDMADSF